MNQSYLDLIELFSSASLGRECKLNDDVNLVEIFELAKNANIWPLVFSQVKKSEIKIEDETLSILDKTVKFNLASYNARCQNVHKVIEKLESENIKVLVHWINIRPINEIKWMHQYCFKYGIPMGTWAEVDQACWEEHPVKWGVPPKSDPYYFEQFVKNRW